MYYIDIEHPGLGKFRRVTGSSRYVVERKAQAQRLIWDDQWQRRVASEAAREARASALQSRESKKLEAAERTDEAQRTISSIRQLLAKTLTLEEATDWAPLYDRRKFDEPPPHQPAPIQYPREPLRSDALYLPRRSLAASIFPFIRRKHLSEAEDRFKRDFEAWSNLRTWEQRKREFENAQGSENAGIDALKLRHLDKDRDAVIEYTDIVLSRSDYPDFFPKRWEIDFVSDAGILIIDYELPPVDEIPRLKAVRYVQSRDAFEESYLRGNEVDQLYESAVYQTCLRTICEIFRSDLVNAVRSVTFNGWVDFIDKSNGRPARACIVSLQTTKERFDDINLDAVDPKSCFRSLKGVGSAKLAQMVPVVPILKMDRADARFVPAHDVIGGVEQGTNIAAIPWEDFEHLVRDVFEKEFTIDGGEVKITRASRDHGVDAVAFDPDPIRGGKIVIQAKRYTNPVGVSAVRDLYGTLINEGASRGILVTTSTYGADSYDFAKDKPLTLLTGGNLLHLLAKHGHPARIDLAEAKKLAAESSD